MELYLKYRPKLLKDVVGQPEAVAMLQGYIKGGGLPHVLLFCGPPGTGKTTLARILKAKLDCSDSDFHEINVAEDRGIDSIRDAKARLNLRPLGGKSRVWLYDECHRWTPDSQGALLKILEDGHPPHAYFMLATTDPHKLLKTILSRCAEVKLRALTERELMDLLFSVAKKEDAEVSPDVIARIAEVADGGARKAVQILQQVLGLPPEQRLEAVQKSETRRQAIDLCRLLIKPKVQWKDVGALLKCIDDEPESVRRLVLAYAEKVVTGGGPVAAQAYRVLTCFEADFFQSGRAGLVRACWEAANG